jgi:hypothetical protein
MAKLGILFSITTIIGAITFANFTMSTPAAEAQTAPACVTTDFKTELVKKACEKGGQKEAKEVMKAWNKEKKIKSCNQCHTKLAPKYELKKDGLEQYKKLGGK